MKKTVLNLMFVFIFCLLGGSLAWGLENPILNDFEIRKAVSSGNSNQIIELNNQLETLWEKGEKEAYFKKKKVFCYEVYTNSPISYEIYETFLSQFLTKDDNIIISESATVALYYKIGLILKLMWPRSDFPTFTSEEFANMRSINTKLITSFIKRVRNELIPNYQPYKTYLSGPVPPIPPPGQGSHNGMNPKSITNEEARVAFEKAIEEDFRRRYMNSRQSMLKNFISVYLSSFEDHFISSYTKKPYRNEELLSYLQLAGYSESEQNEIMGKVKDRIANPPVLFDFNKQWWEQPDQMGNSNKNEKRP